MTNRALMKNERADSADNLAELRRWLDDLVVESPDAPPSTVLAAIEYLVDHSEEAACLARAASWAVELAEVAAVLDRDGATAWDPDEPLADRVRRRLVYGVSGHSDASDVVTAQQGWEALPSYKLPDPGPAAGGDLAALEDTLDELGVRLTPGTSDSPAEDVAQVLYRAGWRRATPAAPTAATGSRNEPLTAHENAQLPEAVQTVHGLRSRLGAEMSEGEEWALQLLTYHAGVATPAAPGAETEGGELVEGALRLTDEARDSVGHWPKIANVLAEEVRRLHTLAASPRPATEGEAGPRSKLCPTCGRWHDRPGEALLGWRRSYDEKWWPLPPGHMPPNYPISDEWVAERLICAAPTPSTAATEGGDDEEEDAKPATDQIVRSAEGLAYTCGLCGFHAPGLVMPDLLALMEKHRPACSARPHCASCQCTPTELIVERIAEHREAAGLAASPRPETTGAARPDPLNVEGRCGRWPTDQDWRPACCGGRQRLWCTRGRMPLSTAAEGGA